MKIMIYIVTFLLVCYGLICLLIYSYQEQFIFYPTKLPLDYTFDFPTPHQEVFYKTEDNAQIHTIHFKTDTVDSKGVILYFHGNAGALDSWGFVASYFTQFGYDCVVVDYRTYGKSNGQLSEKALYTDAQLIYDTLKANYLEQDIIIYGRSLGSGIATDLGTKNTPKLLILETPFLNIATIGKTMFRYLPVNQLLKYRFDNQSKVKKITSPIHIIHGTKDAVIPYWHSQQLMEQIGKQNILTTIEGGNHNNLGQFPEYHRIIQQLLV